MVKVTEAEKQEVLSSIEECEKAGEVEDGILSTRLLADRLNANSSRSRVWRTYWVGQVMSRLGFQPTITKIGYQRAWKIQKITSISE